ncbi:MAG: HAD family phosphatase [Melioribacteraceae bacterium]|nr:HAD family phosphatase [Melioribacteraceae bacterium]
MKKIIFWDNDGVLVNTEKYYYQANKETLAELDIELDEKTFAEISLIKGESVFNLALEKGYSREDYQSLLSKRNYIYKKLLVDNNCLMPGIEKILIELSERFEMAIVTSSRNENFYALHKKTDLLKYFKFVLVREDYKNSKPAPEPYLLALEKSGYSKNEAIIIEDTDRGLEAALSAGIDCIVYPNHYLKDSKFEGAKHIISELSELLELDCFN